MKKIVARQFVVGMMIMSISNFSFAQTSNETPLSCTSTAICGTAPREFTLLMDFVREMMNSMKTIGTQGDYLGQYINPDRYAGDVFTPPTPTAVSKTLRNVNQKAKFALATTAIFSSPVNFAGLKDVLGSTVLLAKNKVFLRDTKLIEGLESQVSDKRYELGLGGGRYTKVNATNRKTMEAIIQKYIDAGLLSQGTIADGVLYNNVSSLLVSTLSAAKTFLYFGRIDQFSTDYFSRGGVDGIKITFAPGVFKKIKDEYTCAQGPYSVCSSDTKQLANSIDNMTSKIAKSATGVVQTITDALDRLDQTFTKTTHQTTGFKAREAELLKTMYGTTKDGKGIFAGSIKKSLDGIIFDVTNLGSDVSRFRHVDKEVSDSKNDIETAQAQQNIVPTAPAQGEETFKRYLTMYVQDVFTQQTTDIQLAYLAEVKDVTPAFNIIGQQIFTIKNTLLDGDGGLIDCLSSAAATQCSIK